jgi:hypothetical protein
MSDAGISRFERLGGRAVTPYKARREAGEVELGPRHRLLAEYLCYGADNARVRRLGYPVNAPLTVEQASDVIGLRRRNARGIMRMPAWQALMAQMVGELKNGVKARAVGTLIGIMDDEGDGTAATKNVRFKAARELLDDGEGRGGVNVNIGINNQVGVANFRPGYVIRLGPSEPSPGGVIEHEPVLRERPLPDGMRRLRELEARAQAEDEAAADRERRKLLRTFGYRPPE